MARLCHDLVVIGSGPAGQKAALLAAKLGKRVAIVDRTDSVGGVCIHTGTVPSKAIREAVLHLTGLRERSVYGDSYSVKQSITMDDLLYRCRHVVRTEVDVIRSQMSRAGASMLFGTASFIDPETVRIQREDETTEVKATHVLVATGTNPARPSNVPFTPGIVIDSDELLTLPRLPKSMIIVGGGVIGTEYACMLAAVGVKVTLVEGRPQLLDFVDNELTESLQFRMRDMKIRLRLGESVKKIEIIEYEGKPVVEATMASNKVIDAECLLYCIGRQGATDRLNLPAAGLTADNRGRLKVNENLQTDVPHIYAAGDVIGFPALAATSMEQGRLAASHMFGQITEAQSPLFPYGIYTIPEISMVGQTEQALTAAGTPYEVGIGRYRETARGLLIADPHGLLKLLFHPQSRRLLGVHAIGTGATELVHIGQAVMAAGLPIDYFVESVFNYPTLAECYKLAAMDGINRVRTLGMHDEPGVAKAA
ncbi:Si-specific NAD(P)(+) transhydrogenase [Humisphaera borealis]|uniref:Soluble pyridine nucleotide transhydrogenase n=1 Tax=Humisphaera borealis TaxID=2807512 RepID=A0A7M2X3J5_9BACT|nr:Si-specific NAD(P)(+) transhydrogenase [Humisphaera borealis]QOV91581.1 Si-specific NAD(P)(+) transhydrogenase [Humisphaera borealis]